MDYVIGCDLGSQGVKVILLTAEGKLAGEAGVGYGIDYPHPTWADQPVSRWTDALCTAVRKLLQETGVSAEQIRAIGLDGQVDGVVAVDAAGEALRPAIIWMDRRAVDQCNAVGKVRGTESIFQITGLNLDPSHVAAKIRWLADREPEVYRKLVSEYEDWNATMLPISPQSSTGPMGNGRQLADHYGVVPPPRPANPPR